MARKILLADDSVTAQNMGRKILADAGYEVATVNNGSAALKRVADLKPDLIVLDVYMPGYSGLEVCQRLKDSDETAHIPVLLSVGKLEPFKPEEARRVRADAHIVKPFEASELLTAITRLEDLLVAQPGNGHRGEGVDPGLDRFRSAGNGRKSENNSSADTGWKSRLGFSSKKKKDEKEETEDAAGTFRDFRKGKRSGAGETKRVKQPSAAEPSRASDPLRDITPAELDALSALAAKLEGSILPAKQDAPLAGETTDEKTLTVASGLTEASEVAVSDAPDSAAVAEFQVLEAQVLEPQVAETQGAEGLVVDAQVAEPQIAMPPVAVPSVEAATPEFPTVEAPVFAIESRSEIEIPVEQVELPAEGVAVVADAVAIAETAAVDTSPAIELATQESSEEQQLESQPSETLSVITATVNAAQFAEEPACVDRDDEPGFASLANAIEQVEMEQVVEDPAPSDAELVQALRLLTPANWNADTSPASGKESTERESRQGGAAPRWVAEPVALGPEEAAISLEAEMFRTFAASPATEPTDAVESVRMSGVAAIEAAVESTLAAAEMIASAEALPEALTDTLPETLTESVREPETGYVPAELNLAQQDPAASDCAASDSAASDFAHGEAETTVAQASIAEERVAAVEMQSVSAAALTLDAGQGNSGEASKAVQLEADEPPKAKAAAAAEGGDSISAPDASTIASIVDRVMADLRPKIVEEITKKLAGK